MTKRPPHKALLVSLALAVAGCTSEGPGVSNCPIAPTATQLCVVTPQGAQAVARLASTDLNDAVDNFMPDPNDPLERLTVIRLSPSEPLTLAIGPGTQLALVEIDVYSSISAINHVKPTATAECGPLECSRWNHSLLRDGWAIEIPAKELEIDNVLIVNAFVDGSDQSGSTSWGIVLDEQS